MKYLLRRFCFLVIVLAGQVCYSQYSISGYLDAPDKPKRVFLSLLKFNELYTISEEQILSSTLTDSLGYFSFQGSLLSDKYALYRIYANINEGVEGVEKYDTPEIKNFHNFIFSNQDTIVFEKNNKFWFSSNTNTNIVDKEWSSFDAYAKKLRNEFLDFSSKQYSSQSSAQFLSALKSYAIEKKAHPLTLLILLEALPLETLKSDLDEDPEFYKQLQNKLNNYYKNSFYALQFNEFLQDLKKEETRKDLKLYRSLTFGISVFCILLIIALIVLMRKLKTALGSSNIVDFSLTSQEEKVAELIVEDKSNKEIASELFISLNTVKTHIRNLYNKLEVKNRREFIDKFKNHPRD